MSYNRTGTPFANLFEAGTSAITDYSENGVPFSNIYQGLEKDQRIPDIGYSSNGTDLAQLLKGNISQYANTLRLTTTRTTAWNGVITYDVDVTWSTTTLMSNFFLYGGRIILSASRTGGSATAKNAEWTSLLNDAGNIELARNETYQNTETQVSTRGYLDLTGSFQVLYQEVGSSPYTNAIYTVYALISGTTITFRIRFDDGASGIVDENIDGTLSSFVNERKHPSQETPTFNRIGSL